MFDFDSSLDKKVDFWNASHESLFHSLKDKTLVHIRVVTLIFSPLLIATSKIFLSFRVGLISSMCPWLFMNPLFACFMLIFALQKLEKLNH